MKNFKGQQKNYFDSLNILYHEIKCPQVTMWIRHFPHNILLLENNSRNAPIQSNILHNFWLTYLVRSIYQHLNKENEIHQGTQDRVLFQ